jgi:hypothetical protein
MRMRIRKPAKRRSPRSLFHFSATTTDVTSPDPATGSGAKRQCTVAIEATVPGVGGTLKSASKVIADAVEKRGTCFDVQATAPRGGASDDQELPT